MRKLTAEQKARSAERKARFSALVKQVAEMSDEQRAEMAAKMGAVVTCDGRALSPRNTMLVAMQRGNVTIVGGFRQWLEKGRCVRKGEHGLNILVPCNPKKDENKQPGEISTKEERVFFITGTVFDISQTNEIEGQVSADRETLVNAPTDQPLNDAEEAALQRERDREMVAPRPLLLMGETQGDLISSTQREDFALASQSAIDGDAVTAAKAESENNEQESLAKNLEFELVA